VTGAGSGVLAFTNSDVGSTYNGIGPGQPSFVKHFRWVKVVASGDQCIVKTSAGDVVFDSEADGANFIDVHPWYHHVNGIVINKLDSGTLYVYLA
jgi:hypothetical protein